jgi:hypothetical protein
LINPALVAAHMPQETETTPAPTARTDRPGPSVPPKGLPAWAWVLVAIVGSPAATAAVTVLRNGPEPATAEDVRLLSMKVDGIGRKQEALETQVGRLETERIEREVARRVREEMARSHLVRSADPAAIAALRELRPEAP